MNSIWSSSESVRIGHGWLIRGVWKYECHHPVYRQHFTVRTHAHFFSLRTPHITRLAQGLTILCVSGKVISLLVMSLVNVPLNPFPTVFSSPTATPTPQTGIRLIPCATPLWGGLAGHPADPTPNTSRRGVDADALWTH